MNFYLLDSDPGIDDACAIILANNYFGNSFSALTTVAGNVSVEKTTINALRIKEAFNFSFKVYRGASRPLIKRFVDASEVHGQDGLGDAGLPLPKIKEEETSAAEAIIRSAKSGNLLLIATGPLTNLALALILEPELPNMIKDLTVMGGAFRLTEFGKGNVTAFSEFNFYEDPEAASLVFESFKKVNVVPLDLTMNPFFWFKRSDLESFPQSRKSSFFKVITYNFMQKYGVLVLHDNIAVDVHNNSNEYEFREGHVKISTKPGVMRGASFLEYSKDYQHRIYFKQINVNRFKERFLKSLY
ncbi:MAG: nucleoside hydrolase [Nitrososphaeria archaeon]